MMRIQTHIMAKHTVTLIPGDGIGPEVALATRRIIEAAGVDIEWDEQVAGLKAFEAGVSTGVPDAVVESLRRTRVGLKGPLETPVGYGGKSANVTLRKLFETYGNIRPCRELPAVTTPFSGRGIDLVVVRENIEDVYAGIEHMQTPSVAQCLKLVTRTGCEKIVRLAFELARAEGRKSIHCCTKANIMKMTEGMLKRVFEEIAPEYPEIRAEHIIVDNAAHQLVRKPEQFEVILALNMNGDILSDLTSGLIGGLGLAPSANIGNEVSIFEAVHGSAPDIAGKNMANPTALLLSATMMLRHLGEPEAAVKITQAIIKTLEDGIFTGDIANGRPATGTTEFTDAVIARLGQTAATFAPREEKPLVVPDLVPIHITPAARKVVGADVFIETKATAEVAGTQLERLVEGSAVRLKMMSNRGTQVYPVTGGMTDCVDHYRCRFVMRDARELSDADLLDLLQRVGAEFHWMHVEKLQEFDGSAAYSKAQGED